MIPFCHRDSIKTRTVQLDRILVISDEPVLSAAKINSSLPFVDLFKRAHIPITIGYLLDHSAIGIVVIDVPPAAASAEPQERSFLQPAQAVVHSIDPGFRRLGKYVRRFTGFWICGIKIEAR